jgi:hypothetical protein
LQHLNTQLALGQPIDLSQHAQAVSAMVRVGSRFGLQRRHFSRQNARHRVRSFVLPFQIYRLDSRRGTDHRPNLDLV